MATRVLLADDHPIVRAGLHAVLSAEPDIEVVGECGSGKDAVRLATDLSPDVVLMDLRMPGLDGFTATQQIVADGSARVLVLTTYGEEGDVLGAVEAGATGYLLKDAPGTELVAAVRDTARGETVLAGSAAAKLVTGVRDRKQAVLTPREIEVLRCVARGLSNQEAARHLFISEATVKTHLLRAFAKLEVGDRTAAVTTAIAQGIMQMPE